MIDEEGTLLLTNETKIPDDMIDKIKKIVIDTSLQGIVFENIFEFENTFKSTKYLINLEEVDFTNYTFHIMYCDSFMGCKKLKNIELPATIKQLYYSCYPPKTFLKYSKSAKWPQYVFLYGNNL